MTNAILEPNREVATSEPANFNRLARVYPWLEWLSFGPILWRCRCAYLSAMKNRRAALVIGDGDGRFTAKLLLENPRITVEAVDASDAMLHRLTQRAGRNSARVHARLADARQLHLARRSFDLVATHFLLDCLTTREVESLAMRVREAMTQDAMWVISEFAIPDNWYGRLIAKPLVSALYLAFGFLTGLGIRQLPEHRNALRKSGFVLTRQQKRMWGLLVSELWELNRSPGFSAASSSADTVPR